MKIQLLSDTHGSPYAIHPDVDVVAHAGDFGNGLDAAYQFQAACAEAGKPCVFVLGNHDYYHENMSDVRLQLRDAPYLRAGKTIQINGWTFVGGTLFSDFELMQNVSESLAGRIAVLKLNGLSWREMRGDDFQTAFVPDEGYLADRNPVFRLPEHENIWQIIHRGDMPRLSAATLRQQPPQTRHQNPESLYAEHRPDGLPDQMADTGNHSKRSQERTVF